LGGEINLHVEVVGLLLDCATQQEPYQA
jgi:hypothetical protein